MDRRGTDPDGRNNSRTDHEIRSTLYYISPDKAQRVAAHERIPPYGYDVITFDTVGAALRALEDDPPFVIIIDANRPDEYNMQVAELKQYFERPIPIVVISPEDSFEQRLQAVRFGGDAYLTSPVGINTLIGAIDTIAEDLVTADYRVLIVERDSEIALHFSHVLRGIGMVSEMLADPFQILNAMADFDPDLVILNLYYPVCLGMELAAVVRQQPTYHSIPIIFHSDEEDMSRRLAAMGRGGDDFLFRPIPDAYLAESIRVRAHRYRTLRSVIINDNLTGLLNHTSVRVRLERAVQQARRHERPLSIAFLDIDKFKRVNDTYGHTAGDQVIKTLARLVKHRSRATDGAGRYGGEEFLLILNEADRETAINVMNRIREDFAMIRHVYESHEFQTTFSSGICVMNHDVTPEQMTEAADRALYEAKKAGGNRVHIAEL